MKTVTVNLFLTDAVIDGRSLDFTKLLHDVTQPPIAFSELMIRVQKMYYAHYTREHPLKMSVSDPDGLTRLINGCASHRISVEVEPDDHTHLDPG